LTGIEFPLTDFPYAYQTWESGENGFQKNEFLETNKVSIKHLKLAEANLSLSNFKQAGLESY